MPIVLLQPSTILLAIRAALKLQPMQAVLRASLGFGNLDEVAQGEGRQKR